MFNQKYKVMKSLLTCLVGVFAIGFITSCSTLSDEEIAPKDLGKSTEKFEVKLTDGGGNGEPGDK